MSISGAAVKRPVFTIMVTFIVILLGAISLSRLPIDLMPDITYPTLSVSVSYGNASPEEMEELITRPLEEALSAVPGVKEITTTSTEGSSSVRISFTWGTDVDAAANDVRDRLDRVADRLPDDATRPMLRKFDINAFPILMMGASSDQDPVRFRRTIEDKVKYRIERVPGVASLDIWGGAEREIRVDLLDDRIKALGIPFETILGKIRAENVKVPGGVIERGRLQVSVRTAGLFTSLQELKDTVVANRRGVPVRLSEVAEILDTTPRETRIVKFNGRRGVRLAVNKQSGSNTVDVADKVLAEIARINDEHPEFEIMPIIDTSEFIRASVNNVSSAAMYGGLLAVVILFVFLRNFSTTAIIATAIPVSVIATFALLYFSGFTLNLMTLGGLALGLGMLLDSSIVVIENIFRQRESGQGPLEAATNGASEVTAAIVASTLTTLAVFLPLVFIRGMAGVMFTQFSYVVAFSLLCSLVASLTLVPTLAARFMRGDFGASARNPSSTTVFAGVENTYRDILGFCLKHRIPTLLFCLALLGASLPLARMIGVELMPASDEGEVRIDLEMEPGTRLETTLAAMEKLEEIVKAEVPEAKNLVTSIGGGFRSSGTNTGQMRIPLKAKAQRTRSSEEVAAALRGKTSFLPGAAIRISTGGGMPMMRMGQSGSDRLQVEVRGHDLIASQALAGRVKEIMNGIDGVTNVRVSREAGAPEEMLVVDREKAADLKISVSQVANLVETALSGTTAGYYKEGGDEYPIVVKLKNSEQLEVSQLLDLTLNNSDGTAVVLRNVAGTVSGSAPMRIDRKNQERLVTVTGGLENRDMGSALEDVRQNLREVPVREDLDIVFGGEYEEQQEAFRELAVSLALALVLVYMVMACQYESLRDPFAVMFSVPLAAVGVIIMLFLTKTTFNMQAFIGCIMLGGVAVNNAILLVDQTKLLRERDGMALFHAIEEAGRRRLRPILMTALTTMLGLSPLALGLGESGEAQAPMARVVIGGLASSMVITLIFVPVIYSFITRKTDLDRRKPDLI